MSTKKSEFRSLDDVAVRTNQLPDDLGSAPEHESFKKDGKVLLEKCSYCDAEYLIGFQRIHGTKRSFEDLRDQLRLRLEEDHLAGRLHPSLIPLRWSDTTRERAREEKS
jgi:hypothetical protein